MAPEICVCVGVGGGGWVGGWGGWGGGWGGGLPFRVWSESMLICMLNDR